MTCGSQKMTMRLKCHHDGVAHMDINGGSTASSLIIYGGTGANREAGR